MNYPLQTKHVFVDIYTRFYLYWNGYRKTRGKITTGSIVRGKLDILLYFERKQPGIEEKHYMFNHP